MPLKDFLNLAEKDENTRLIVLYVEPGGTYEHEGVEMMREKFGLDDPLHIQFYKYMVNMLQGNLGYSVNGPPVLKLILERLPNTLILTGSG